jgi:hypothetical protein
LHHHWHHHWCCIGRGVRCFSLHRLHGRGAQLGHNAASPTALVRSGLLALLPRLPALGMGSLALGLLRDHPLLTALLGTGLHGLPPACLLALRPWSSALRALAATAWSNRWCSGRRERLRGVGMGCKWLRVAGVALGAWCPTDIACEVIIAHLALLHLRNARLECLDLAGLRIAAQHRTGAQRVATACNCARG